MEILIPTEKNIEKRQRTEHPRTCRVFFHPLLGIKITTNHREANRLSDLKQNGANGWEELRSRFVKELKKQGFLDGEKKAILLQTLQQLAKIKYTINGQAFWYVRNPRGAISKSYSFSEAAELVIFRECEAVDKKTADDYHKKIKEEITEYTKASATEKKVVYKPPNLSREEVKDDRKKRVGKILGELEEKVLSNPDGTIYWALKDHSGKVNLVYSQEEALKLKMLLDYKIVNPETNKNLFITSKPQPISMADSPTAAAS